jgi:hypothetical protein
MLDKASERKSHMLKNKNPTGKQSNPHHHLPNTGKK